MACGAPERLQAEALRLARNRSGAPARHYRTTEQASCPCQPRPVHGPYTRRRSAALPGGWAWWRTILCSGGGRGVESKNEGIPVNPSRLGYSLFPVASNFSPILSAGLGMTRDCTSVIWHGRQDAVATRVKFLSTALLAKILLRRARACQRFDPRGSEVTSA
jgi:hypothetical protein